MEKGRSYKMLTFNTLAFTVCFACWTLNGVLVTFLVDSSVFKWDSSQIGLLLGIPILTGAVLRLPIGILTDRFGGKYVFGILLLLSAIPTYLLSFANSYSMFIILSLGFGITGSSFAVGIAYTSVWFSKEKQGTALGIFGAGNVGASLTTLFAPSLLKSLTNDGTYLDGWRTLPIYYAIMLIVMGILFLIFTNNKKTDQPPKTIAQSLLPLKQVRVWRFGLYYYLVFGSFVALSQWLVGYYLNVYAMSLITAGFLTTLFSFPAGFVRAIGGVISDKFGARKVLYWVFGLSAICTFLLIFPRMEIYSPGSGLSALREGTVSFVSDSLITIGEQNYKLNIHNNTPHNIADRKESEDFEKKTLIFPTKQSWLEPLVNVGEHVQKKQLIAKGTTRIYFQANVWVFTGIVFVIAILWGIGSAAVYKHIPTYFPREVGVVGGMVGVLGALGGFFSPMLFGYLLDISGVWTTMWMFLVVLSVICLVWMHKVVTKMMKQEVPALMRKIEQ